MKILFIAPQPFMANTGTPLAILQLLRALTDIGHSIDLITYHLGEEINIDEVKHYRIPRIPFIKEVKEGQFAAKIFLDIFIAFKAIKLLSKNRYDCIHAVDEAAVLGILLKRLFNVSLIYDIDSSISEQFKELNPTFWRKNLLMGIASFFENWVISHADLVLAVCPALKKRVNGISPYKQVVVIEDIPIVESYDLSMKERLVQLVNNMGISGETVVLYTGTFGAYQGIDLLLKAIPYVIKEFSNVKFILIGGEPKQAKEKSKAVSSEITGNVIVLGKRPLEEMPLFLEIADILVSPRNKGTNTPIKIYTYLQSGRPIVATRLLTHTQVLSDEVSIMVEPEPKAFSNGIITLLKDKELRITLGEAGKRLVEKYYNYERFKAKVNEAYNLVLVSL